MRFILQITDESCVKKSWHTPYLIRGDILILYSFLKWFVLFVSPFRVGCSPDQPPSKNYWWLSLRLPTRTCTSMSFRVLSPRWRWVSQWDQEEIDCIHWYWLHSLISIAFIDIDCIHWYRLHSLILIALIDIDCIHWYWLHSLISIAFIDIDCIHWYRLHSLILIAFIDIDCIHCICKVKGIPHLLMWPSISHVLYILAHSCTHNAAVTT